MLSSLLKPTVEMKAIEFVQKNHMRTMQKVCMVTTQPFNEGSLDMETFAFASAVHGYHVYQDIWKPSIGEKLVAKQKFNNPIGKHAVKVVKDNETVGHLPREFS